MKKWLKTTGAILLAVGAINWGLTVFGYNLVSGIANMVNVPAVATIVYSVIAIFGVISLVSIFRGK